ncbi:Rib/alpha-like domain-containing protein [Peptoniphilus harei]|uniref:Rib/alpha-like domain-containing protein n=1 Tax=Peptoniphilus harei TaxID=54005 RepID=UPI00254F16B8|nr:Rib/alpha-like domain-containing protein [Peptoniphilus harei]MDK7376240.1 Rib/alpha-like domain-containing protein [Peptoniphilus harei]MDK7678857.1 Rib/alpha-like domain-containing protein [Peptoniphilus harei]
MNRKMFSLVTSFAILSSSFSPTWAAGKNFTYNNLEKSLAIHAEAKEVKSSEAKEELPLVTETMPNDRVKDKYARIIFVPKTSKVDGVQNFGKLLDKDNKEVLLSDISYKNNIIKGKEYYVLKDAKWKNILFYKENNKQVLSVRKAVNNESDPDKKKVHEFLAWTRNGIKVEPFYDTYPINIKSHSIENPLIFTAIFQTSPYFYSLDDSRNFDSDGYRIYRTYIGKLIVDEYNEVLFMATSEDDKLMGDISLYDSQKKYANYEGDFSKKIYLYIRKNSGTHSFADFKPETINSEGKTFWFWSVDSDFSGPVEDDFDIGKIDQVYRAQFIVDYIRIHDNFDLGKNPIPSGCYEVDFQAEDGYLFRNPLRYKRYAVREGKTLEGIISKFSLEPKLKDKNNVEYKGKVAWYDGFTKIDNIKEVKINSNKVFTARRVRDFESEKFNSVVKEVKVKLNEDVSSEKLKEGITNLPKNVEVEIKTKADTSKVGQTKAVLKITFSDTSSKEVEVPIKVIEREDGKLITPIPTIGAEDIIKEEVPYNGKIDLSDNIKNLPDGAKIEDVSDSINTKTPGKYIGKVKVTFKDGSSRIVEILVEVLAPLSDSYNPSTKEVEVKLNEDVSPEKLKEGITNLPKNVEVEIKTKADTSKAGKTKAVLKLIFSDTSVKEVKVLVKVVEKIDGGIVKPIPTIKAEDIIKEKVSYNGKINLLDNIKNLPSEAKVEDISETIDTKTPGIYIGKVKVTFKGGSSRIVEIPVEVLAPLSDSYNPSTKEVEVNLNEDVSLEKLKEGITNLPKNVEVEIKTRADTSKVVKTKAVLKLIFSDSSSKEVEVPVKIIDKISGNIITPVPTIKAEDIIKEDVPYNGKINLLDNIKNLPDGAKLEGISEAIDTKTPGSYVGKVKVTFKDGSSRIVEVPVEVLTPLAEKFQVKKPEKTLVEKLESLSASEKSEIVEKVKIANPQAVTVVVSDKGEVTLVYSDGSKNTISSEDIIELKEKESDKKGPEDKPGKEDKKDPEEKPGKEENKDPEEKPGKEDKKDPEDKPDKKEDKKKSEENNEEARDNKENKLDSWNEFPIYYVRDYVTPTYKVDVKINSHVADTKTQVNPKKFVIDIKSGTYTLTEDGKTLEKSMEVKPIIENNRTMLPLRALAEILGAKVIWNDATRTASFTRDGLTALIQIDGNKIVLSNGKTIDLEAKPLNVNGRIYLPLVYVGQVFGLTSGNADYDKENDIEWKEESKTVTINIK